MDKELENLIAMSGLQENYIASELSISPVYFSQIKTGIRKGTSTRQKIKVWLVEYISNYMNFAKRAA